MTTMRSVNHSDRNLFFNVNRENLRQPVTYGNYIPESYYKNGRFTKEAAARQYPVQLGKGGDKNIFFKTKKRKTPFLPKRLFKDLEPQSRVLGKLDKTKKELQATAVLKNLEEVQKTLLGFLQTEKTDAAGNVIIDPVTNKPTMEVRTLNQVLKASEEAIYKIFRNNNIAVNPNLNMIINSFNNQNVLNTIGRFRDIEVARPNLPPDDRAALYRGVVINERMRDMERVQAEEKLFEAVGNEVVDEKMIEDDWKGAGYEQEHLSPRFMTSGNMHDIVQKEIKLAQFIMTRSRTALAPELTSVNGIPISPRVQGMQLARNWQLGHYLNLDTLRFTRRNAVPPEERDP